MPYGKPYEAGSVQPFAKGQSQLVFGLRHGTNMGSNRMLEGRLFEARLFDRALSAEEVKAIADGATHFISPSQIFESLTDAQKIRETELKAKSSAVQEELGKIGQPLSENDRWQNFAHSIFNLKEFIYVY